MSLLPQPAFFSGWRKLSRVIWLVIDSCSGPLGGSFFAGCGFFFSAFFFLAGASFCYFLVFPIAFQFFMGFATDVIVPMISVEEYLSFALKLLIAFGLVFEMPLFAYFLAKMGLLTPDMMRNQRKYAILAIFIVAAILTPPDVFSQCLMAAPMLVLYEVSIYVAASARKKRDERNTTQKTDVPEDSAHEES